MADVPVSYFGSHFRWGRKGGRSYDMRQILTLTRSSKPAIRTGIPGDSDVCCQPPMQGVKWPLEEYRLVIGSIVIMFSAALQFCI